jgi:hypothetical protein
VARCTITARAPSTGQGVCFVQYRYKLVVASARCLRQSICLRSLASLRLMVRVVKFETVYCAIRCRGHKQSIDAARCPGQVRGRREAGSCGAIDGRGAVPCLSNAGDGGSLTARYGVVLLGRDPLIGLGIGGEPNRQPHPGITSRERPRSLIRYSRMGGARHVRGYIAASSYSLTATHDQTRWGEPTHHDPLK